MSQRLGHATRDETLGKRRVQLDGPLAGRPGLVQVGLRRFEKHVEERSAIRETAVPKRVVRIDLDGPLEHLPRHLEMTSAELIQETPAAQVVLVGADVERRLLLDGALLPLRERDPQRIDDLLRDLFLDLEDVAQAAVESV